MVGERGWERGYMRETARVRECKRERVRESERKRGMPQRERERGFKRMGGEEGRERVLLKERVIEQK